MLVEVDEDTAAYIGGHICGAVALNWKTDLQDSIRRPSPRSGQPLVESQTLAALQDKLHWCTTQLVTVRAQEVRVTPWRSREVVLIQLRISCRRCRSPVRIDDRLTPPPLANLCEINQGHGGLVALHTARAEASGPKLR